MSLFYNMNESQRVEKITMKWPADGYVIPAGTPVSATGVANNGDAIGILASEARVRYPYPLSIAEKVGKKEPKGNLDYTFSVITGGFVNRKEAETAFGDTYSEAAISAMTDISFINPQSAKFGGGATSWDDLGKGGEDAVIVEPITLSYGTEVPVRGEFELSLEVGKRYSVTWDGVQYEGVCAVNEANEAIIGLGNASLLGGSATSEPFYVGVQDGRSFAKAQTAGEHTLSITLLAERVPIPKELLPKALQIGGEVVTLVDNVTVECVEQVELDGMVCAVNPFSIEFVEGNRYAVTFDGNDYVCVAYMAPIVNATSIGNGTVAGLMGGKGEPFFCTTLNGHILFCAETGSHTVSITEEVVSPLDTKYLPKALQFGTTVEKTEIFPATELELDCSVYDGVGFVGLLDIGYLTAGRKYTVVYNGVEYICTAFTHADGNVRVGNMYWEDNTKDDTGEPFFIDTCPPEWGSANTLWAEPAETCTLEVFTTAETITPVKEKYLPFYSFSVTVTDEKWISSTIDYATLKAAYDNHIPIFGSCYREDLGKVWTVSEINYDAEFEGGIFRMVANDRNGNASLFWFASYGAGGLAFE